MRGRGGGFHRRVPSPQRTPTGGNKIYEGMQSEDSHSVQGGDRCGCEDGGGIMLP